MANAPDSVSDKDQREILPSNIRPTHYFLSYSSVDLEKFTFAGRVEIDLDVRESCSSITLNAAELEFLKVSVGQNNNNNNSTPDIDIDIDTLRYDAKKEQMTIALPFKLQSSVEYKLVIEFTGVLNDKMKGFYRSRYKLSDGSDGWCGCTQFEATDARRAFPCWDEPAVKAKFTVQMTAPKCLTVLSNMPVVSTHDIDDPQQHVVAFDTTPVMSTYLLAWVIGEFESIQSRTQRDVLVRVWTTMGNKSKAQLACDVACRCLDFYESYFGINYPLPKLDMIGVPDFAAGAMENWGLITYREVALLCDAQSSSLRARQYVVIVVCHELAHQWFGNLVTMEWWSQLWLNEGFACFCEYLSADALFPQWRMWNTFLLSEYGRAFELDAMSTSHAIEVEPLNTAAEAEEMFDSISYCKGAAVIRMLEAFIGKDAFRSALHKYLSLYKYQNAVTNDLWQFLAQESKQAIGLIMQNWTRKQGFPLISASRTSDDKLTLSQKRFLISGGSADEEQKQEEMTVIWNVPLNVRIDGQVHKLLLDAREKTFDIASDAQCVHINADSTGFYCCRYDEPLLRALNSNLGSLSVMDRVALLRDARALACSGSVQATLQLLEIVRASANETEYAVWKQVLEAMHDIVHIVDEDAVTVDHLNAIMQRVLRDVYDTLGFDAEKQQQKKKKKQDPEEEEDETTSGLLRPLIVGAMAKYGNQAVIDESLKRFRAFMAADKDDGDDAAAAAAAQVLPPAIRSGVYATAIKHGGEAEFMALKKYYNTSNDAMEKDFALSALGQVRWDNHAMQSFLEWVLTSDEVRSQDKVFPFRTFSHCGAPSRELAWQFLQQRWTQWFKLFEGGFLVQHLAKIPSGFVSMEKAQQVQGFYDQLENVAVCKRAMKQCVETITQNANWRTQCLSAIQKWAQQNNQN
eukprot:CAMPEP_0202691708 /NCGR_PEP_ID=MMETSP1385-20130828/6352_1 /ASSEMBLY_ACC=CAM_ASM_000861 /TAXON_ID=933848 /ORGANISM="Elphidium margaritaceum" /LENGTH=913 /DNA_ID=CAMNT_0049347151 /DNA_START=33 /DNA_END=2774 /DNA_ORIENTATION=+